MTPRPPAAPKGKAHGPAQRPQPDPDHALVTPPGGWYYTKPVPWSLTAKAEAGLDEPEAGQ